ncbi:MAG: GntR family transcriptional regulator [Acetobacteraceae bacterium]|jgi:GntR family transcriptional regulator
MESHRYLHERIQAALRSAIQGGEFPSGQPLPGEHALAARFGAARMTVRRALAALEAEGLVRREAGRGTWPSPDLPGVNADIRRFAAGSSVQVISAGPAPLPAFAAALLGLAEGLAVLRLVRVRGDAVGPFSHVTTFVPPGLLDDLDPGVLGSGAVLDALAERGHVGAGAEQFVAGAAADPEVAALLGVPPGTALTRLDRVVRAGQGAAIEASRSLYRPDRFVYAVPIGADAHPPRWAAAEDGADHSASAGLGH